MKFYSLVALFIFNNCLSQQIELKPVAYQSGIAPTEVYSLKIFNNLPKPIAIRCSPFLANLSEKDTLELATGGWYKVFDNYYGLDFSKEDAKSSEGPSFYVLLIVYPQTYLRTNIKLRNLKNQKAQFFYLVYTDSLTNKDIGNYSDRNHVPVVMDERSFQTKVVEIRNESLLSEPEEAIIKFIKKDFLKRNHQGLHSISFIKSNQRISIDLTDFLPDIISEKYVKDFSFSNQTQVKQYKQIIAHVQDSLRRESDRLNSLCEAKDEPAIEIEKSPHLLYLFFSNNCNNMIYVQLVDPRGISILNHRYQIMGPVKSYLFQMSNDSIRQVYRGLIAFD